MKISLSPLATFVRARRKGEGMTQVQLASLSGVGLRFVRELENDKPTLRMDKVNQVLWLFGHRLEPVGYDAFENVDDHA